MIDSQIMSLIRTNQSLRTVLDRMGEMELPSCCVGAGAICQTVWNHLHGFEPEAHISDIDFVYYDASDLSYDAEDRAISKAKDIFGDLSIPVDLKNQARVHVWHKEKFGYDIPPYESIYQAIDSWPTTSTTVAIFPESTFTVYSKYGLNDIFQMIVRPNKVKITKDIYDQKTEKWIRNWPKLTIASWDSPNQSFDRDV